MFVFVFRETSNKVVRQVSLVFRHSTVWPRAHVHSINGLLRARNQFAVNGSEEARDERWRTGSRSQP